MTASYFVAIFALFFLCNGEKSDSSSLIRVDCYPDPNASQQKCLARGLTEPDCRCIWTPSRVRNAPWCFFNPADPGGYDVEDIQHSGSGLIASLNRRNSPTVFGGDIQRVQLVVQYETNTKLTINFKNHLLHPEEDAMRHFKATLPERDRDMATDSNKRQYEVAVQQQPFGIAVTRKSTGTVLFDTRNMPGFVMEEQFLSITTKPPNSNIYGFGENTHPNLRHDMNWHKWPMFSRDQAVTGTTMNLYGVHPFYMNLEDDGKTNGVLLMNAHAQYVELAPYPSITYRTIGGSLEFHIFLGANPEEVVRQYIQMINLPMMPPYWSLGFHLCRYGYQNVQEMQQVVDRTSRAGIPQDTQWADIDYMYQYRDFTYNTENFATLPQFAEDLHKENKKLVLILDPCISDTSDNYPPLSDGMRDDIFIKNSNGQPLKAQVWPGECYFPDFTKDKAKDWWTSCVSTFHNSVPFDGLWIDMNEPSNFVSGSSDGCPHNKYNNPPFTCLYNAYLPEKTICMDVQQAWGRHYDVHSMYGYTESIATDQALTKVFPGKRPFVLTRSTYLGSGRYAAHWTGDNEARFIQMQWSINTILEFQMFGIPFVGADICGFNGEPTEELCTRWMQLGAFYPLSRNHNAKGTKPQDPGVFGPKSIASSRRVLLTRYKLLPYLYTLFHFAHTTGSTVARPLFFEWSSDRNTWGIQDQFLWGDAFMIVPILTERTTSRTAYFPASRWFNYFTGEEVTGSSSGRNVSLNIDEWSIGLYTRGGRVIPWQMPALTTVDSRKNSMGLLVSLDENQYATGSLFWDDGESLGTDRHGTYLMLHFNATLQNGGSNGKLDILRVTNGYRGSDGLNFAEIDIFGVRRQPSRVTVNGNTVPAANVNYGSNV